MDEAAVILHGQRDTFFDIDSTKISRELRCQHVRASNVILARNKPENTKVKYEEEKENEKRGE